MPEERAQLRRLLSVTLVVTLCIAALTAIVAILSGDFDEMDWRVIGTSVGFAVFSATATSGGALRYRPSEALRSLGLVTVLLSAFAFVTLVVAVWEVSDGDSPWRWFACSGLAAFAASHASVVLGAIRETDSDGVHLLAGTSIALGVLDSLLGILAISEQIEADEGSARVLAVLVVLLVLTSVLQPIMRRLQGPQPARAKPSEPPMLNPFAAEVIAAAERIEALNADPGNRAPEIRRECERLRELARTRAD